jgi:sialic acid synthase SpsE
LHTRHLPEVVGKRASRDIKRGTPLNWDLVAKT